jgi:hypothetical protein
MGRVMTAILLAGSAALTSGCAVGSMVTGSYYDPAVMIGQPATFAWNEPDGLPVGDPRLDNNPFFQAQLHGAIAREFAARGIRMAVGDRKPSLFVHYHATVDDHAEVLLAEPTSRGFSPYGPGTQVYQYEEGNFLVDVVDARTNELVWRGWARGDLMGTLDEPKALDEILNEAVTGMFKFFPIPEGTLPAVEQEPPMIEPVPDILPLPTPDIAREPAAPQPSAR